MCAAERCAPGLAEAQAGAASAAHPLLGDLPGHRSSPSLAACPLFSHFPA